MSRLLSQEEVDALLASYDAPGGPASAGEAAPFDLRAPLVLAGERLALVQAACEAIAERIAEALTLVLASLRPVRAAFTGLLQQPSGAVLAGLAAGEPLGLLVDERLDPVGGLSLAPELALSIVDRLQGGSGAVGRMRPLSPVERGLLGGALDRLTRQLDAGTPLAPLRSGGLDDDPLCGRLAQRGGTLATASIRVELDDLDTHCRLFMSPALTDRLTAESSGEREREVPATLLDALAEVPVAVEPVISGGTLSLAEVQRIGRGQVLQLDLAEGETIGLRVNGALAAEGQLRRGDGGALLEIRHLVGADAAPGEELR